MTAVARNRRTIRGTLAIRSAILTARRRRTTATRMRTLFNFLLGPSLPSSVPKSIRPADFAMRSVRPNSIPPKPRTPHLEDSKAGIPHHPRQNHSHAYQIRNSRSLGASWLDGLAPILVLRPVRLQNG